MLKMSNLTQLIQCVFAAYTFASRGEGADEAHFQVLARRSTKDIRHWRVPMDIAFGSLEIGEGIPVLST
jgi:hypothetical protein